VGYTGEEMGAVPAGANLGLGCGNPTGLAGIREGETVVDLGSGAGFDCFLAARRVGPSGRVIGVDMTAEMISRARQYAVRGSYANVEFRLGEIEHLPVADSIADLVISNCVINLSTDKPSVFGEAFRVLKPGGRLMVSDIVLNGELPDAVKNDGGAHSACIAGAVERSRYLGMLRDAGFERIQVLSETAFTSDLVVRTGDEGIVVPSGVVVSISVAAVR
jgi:SAM-dependent methyltransferase